MREKGQLPVMITQEDVYQANKKRFCVADCGTPPPTLGSDYHLIAGCWGENVFLQLCLKKGVDKNVKRGFPNLFFRLKKRFCNSFISVFFVEK